MKAKKLLCAFGIAALVFSGCAGQQSRMEFIGNEEAKRLALADAGLAAQEVQFTGLELENRSGVDYYQVDFTASGQNYEYDIDAITGAVIASNGGQNGQPADTAADTDGQNSLTKQKEGNGVSPQSQSVTGDAESGTVLTADEAKKKALKHAGLSNGQVTFIKSELDVDHGRQIYEVEFYAEDGREYDYEIDALTGEVVSFDYDAENMPQSGGTSKMLTENEIKKLALAQVPGASEQDIYEFEVDSDDGRIEYDGKIIYNGMEYEFSIDAYSGGIRSWEAEPFGD